MTPPSERIYHGHLPGKLPTQVKIVEVGPRDGLQNEQNVATEVKLALINRLSDSGLKHIETGAFVSAKRVPQMADSLSVFHAIERHPNVIYSALTPNIQGFEIALAAKACEVAVFTSASEGFCQNNIHCSVNESLKRFESVLALAKLHGLPVRGYVSCVLECPFDGSTSPQNVTNLARSLLDMGCYEISLGDTIGRGTPLQVARLLDDVSKKVDPARLAVHFHNTWGQALPNIYQALLMGITTIDSSIAGLGGCPYAPGASGNVATEDVIYLCEQMGVETGVDLQKAASAGWMICDALGISPRSNVSLALRSQN